MTATIVDKSTCSKCGSEPRCGKSSWGRACLNGAAKVARERKRAGLPIRPRGRPKKVAQNGSTESTEPIHAAIVSEDQAETVPVESAAIPEPERTERTPGHGAWCAGMCCRVAPQA